VGYYAACSGNFIPTFRDNLSVPSSKEKNPKRKLAQAKPYGVYIKKGARDGKFSVAWCQPLGLMQMVGWERECGD
jgi:hypothetical protein